MKLSAYPILMAISAIVIFSPLVYFNYQNTSSPPSFLEPYLLTGFIIQGVVTFLLADMLQKKRELQNKYEIHIMEINEIFKRLCHVGFRTQGNNRSEIMLTMPRNYYISPKRQVSLNPDRVGRMMDNATLENIHYDTIDFDEIYRHQDYQDFDFAIEHLKNKEYDNIYKHWENVWKIINAYSQQSQPVLDELKKELDLFSTELHILVNKLKAKPRLIGKCSQCS